MCEYSCITKDSDHDHDEKRQFYMFDKAVQTAFVCLRCQSRLLRPRPTRSSLVRLRRPKDAARWQSTAVARVEEEEEQEAQQDNNGEVAHEDGDFENRHNGADPLELRPRRERKGSDQYRTAYRTFRPERVAELGVSSLGKPAEVLVLQPRDRHIPRVLIEEDGQQDPHLLEALQAETVPLDPEQVKHNIEQIKKPFGDVGQALDGAQWKELKQNLVKGFTHLQLLDYIRHMEASKEHSLKQAVESPDASPSSGLSSKLSRMIREKPEMKKGGRNKIKKRAAVSIMKDIWAFSPPAGEEEAESVQSVTVNMSRRHIGALKAQNVLAFKRISESLKVKIDVFQDKSKLVIHGNTDAIEEARKALDSMTSQVTSMYIELSRKNSLLPGLRDGKYEQMLLHEVGRNRPLYIEKKNVYNAASSLRIFFHESERPEAEAARRDILLAGHEIRQRSSISSWPQLNQQSTWLVPYTSWQVLPWWEKLDSWGRLSILEDADVKAENAPPTHEAPAKALTMEVSKWLSCANPNTNAVLRSAPITQHDTAVFGQAVFRQDIQQRLQSVLKVQQAKASDPDRCSAQEPNHLGHHSGPRLMADIPLLAQSLASCKPWSIPTQGPDSRRPPSASTGGFTHRLLLLPVIADPYSPPLQIYLKGDDSHSGLRQPLRIHSIAAILEERSHFLLLPHHAVDVELRRQTLHQIYTANRKKSPKNDQFFDQLLKYLNQAQGQEVPGFAVFVTLNLPPDLAALCNRLGLARASGLKEIKSLSAVIDSTPPAPSAPLKSCRKVPAAEYVLAASETVDVSSFSHGAAKGLCLDHVQFSELDGMQSRQELRLAERPCPDILDSSSPFSQLFEGAYAVASRLGDPMLLKESA